MEWLKQFVRPSMLDNFIKYKSGIQYNFGDQPEYTTELFIDKLLRIESLTKFIKADAGTAIHKLFEVSNGILHNAYKINEWLITIPADLDVDIYVPIMREVQVKGTISNINIVGRVDSMDGISVHDIKTTSKIDIDKYTNSYQWRCYLYLTGLKYFVYDILNVKVDQDAKAVRILDYVKHEVYYYEGMYEDVENLIDEYYHVLLTLSDKIIERKEQYNNDIDKAISSLESLCVTLPTVDIELNNTINQIKNKKLIIKGL